MTLIGVPLAHEGFDGFVVARYPALLRLAFTLTGDAQEAQDVVQSSLVKIWLSWRSIRQEDPFGYARRVLTNEFLRRRSRRSASEVPVDRLPGPERGHHDRRSVEDGLVLREALLTLPPRMRAVVVLRYREDLSERQTAELLGMSLGSVKSQASRGLAELRRALGDPLLTGEVKAHD